MSQALRASVVVATRNRGAVLTQSLRRLLDQDLAADDYEVIVVDDASTDETPDALASLRAPNLVVTRQAVHGAAAAARNRGIELARGGLLVFVDDDAFVARDFLRKHIDAHVGARDRIVAGPIIEVSEIPVPADNAAGNRRGWHMNPFPSGNVSVNRDLIARAGGFDEDFREYGWEDSEIHMRLLSQGGKRGFAWEAPIYHYKSSATRRDFPSRLRLERMRGAMGSVFYAKHSSIDVGLRTKQISFLRALDVALNSAFGLDAMVDRALETGWTPSSAFVRLLLINHAEISAGIRHRRSLGLAD